jgi:putative redox protein
MDEWREVTAEWMGDSVFTGRNQSGGSVQIGSFEEQPGVGPMEMLLLGLAGCTGMDIVSILQKKKQDLQRFNLRVRGLRAQDYPKIYTDIEVVYELWGNIQPEAVEHAIQLSEEKYCSVSLMLGKAARITSRYVIFDAAATAAE